MEYLMRLCIITLATLPAVILTFARLSNVACHGSTNDHAPLPGDSFTFPSASRTSGPRRDQVISPSTHHDLALVTSGPLRHVGAQAGAFGWQ